MKPRSTHLFRAYYRSPRLYQSGDTRWDKGEPSPGLVDFLAAHPVLPRVRVLVPGCGTGSDVLAWGGAGFEVTGLDLVPSAIRRSRERAKADAHRPRPRLEILRGNFLEFKPPARFDWVFEHTLSCAIDPSRRDDCVRAVGRCLKPRGQFLAVHYMLRDADAPLHGCTQQELMERFAPNFELKQGWVPRSYPNRGGLELMLWWQPKSNA